MLRIWHIASHAIALAGVLALPVAVLARGLGVAMIGAHAWWRRPRAFGRLVATRDGLWALPDRGAVGLKLSPRTRYGSWWIDLRLSGPGQSWAVLLCRDQLDRERWRRLQARLRRELAQKPLS